MQVSRDTSCSDSLVSGRNIPLAGRVSRQEFTMVWMHHGEGQLSWVNRIREAENFEL